MAAFPMEDVPARLQRLNKPFALGYYYRLQVDGNSALLDAVSGLHATFTDDKDFMKALKGIGFVVADPARGSDKEGEAKKRKPKGDSDVDKTAVATKQKPNKPVVKTFTCGIAGSHFVAKPANSEDWRIVDMPEIITPTALAAISWDASDLPRPTSAVEKVTTFRIRLRQDGEWRFQPNEYGDVKIAGLMRLHKFLKGELTAGEGPRKVGQPKNPDVRAFDCGLAGKRFVIKPAGARGGEDWRVVTRPATVVPQLGDLDWAASDLPRHTGPVEKVTRFHIRRVADGTWRFRPCEYAGVRVPGIQRLFRLLRGDAAPAPTEGDAPKPSRQVFKDVVSFDCGVADGHIVMKPAESESWSLVKKPEMLQPADLATRPWATLDLPRHDGDVYKATRFQVGRHCSGEWKFKPFKLGEDRVGGLQRLCRLLKGEVQPGHAAADALGEKLNAASIGEKPAKKKFPPGVVQKLQAIPPGSQIQIQHGKVVSNVAVVGADGKVTDANNTWNSVMDWALPYKTDTFRCGQHILVNAVKFRSTDFFHVSKEYVVVPTNAVSTNALPLV